MQRLTAIAVAGIASICCSTANASIGREGTEIQDGSIDGRDVQKGRSSWFGQYGYGPYNDGQHRHVWRDSGDNGRNASGLAQTVPGIALYDRRTLGHWFEVELNGRTFLVRQVDHGPHPRTGRKIDINAPLSDMAGWSPRNFPTDSIVKWRYVGPPATMLAQRQKPNLKQLALLDLREPGMSDVPKLAYDLVSPIIPPAGPRANLTLASATAGPWLASAPQTRGLLTAPRHWSSLSRRARPDLLAPEAAPVRQVRVRPVTLRRIATRPRHQTVTLVDQLFNPLWRLVTLRW